ncbi:MAG: DUF898 domain-containing protein [Cryobacterium sp.]|nr:DUF898 domain-containing protein [Cryobacterium sp.]
MNRKTTLLAKQTRFTFDGGAATWFGTALLGTLITTVTLGIAYPFALVLTERWRAKHTFIDGHGLVFTGSAVGLFGLWIKWFLLAIITAGVYLLWVVPRIQQWITVNTEFAVPVAPLQTINAYAPPRQSVKVSVG